MPSSPMKGPSTNVTAEPGRSLTTKNGFSSIFLRWLLLTGWGGALLWLSLTPSPPAMPAGLLSWDKLQHAAAFGMLTLLAGRAFTHSAEDVRRRWRQAVAVSIIMGLLVEVAQGVFTTYRTAEVGDLLADCLGAAAVYWAAMRVNRGRGKNG